MTKLLELPEALKLRRQFGIHDDFMEYTDGQLWTKVATDLGGVTLSDGAGGVVVLDASDATVADNDEIYLKSTKELFKFAASKPVRVEARLQYAEANTDDANIIFGLADAVGANTLLDNGGGPKASYSGAVIFKVDGGTVWQCESSISTTQVTTVSQHTAGGSSYHTLAIECMPITSTTIEARFFLDTAGGQNLKQMRDANGALIKHTITLGTSTEMQVFVGAKNGGANEETLSVDYIAADQLR